MNSRAILYMCLFFGLGNHSFAQDKKPEKDSINVYEKIEDYSKRRKSTKFLHKLIFKSTNKKPTKQTKARTKQNLKPFEGKIIRNINIQSHDPFGFSFTDSTETANSWLEKTGNNIHIRTKKFTIRDFLLLKENLPLDILEVDESARLLRSQNFIRSVEITVKNVNSSKDSVDVNVNVLDSWSLIPKVDISTTQNTLKLRDRNFLGFGHQFEGGITNRLDDGRNGYNLRYYMPNFKNTFINTTIGYNYNLRGYYNKYLNVNRPFYSPLTRWAGGISLDELFRREAFLNDDLTAIEENFKFQSYDFWLGHSYRIFEGTSEKERTTNLISSVRLLNLDFKEAPSAVFDSINYFSNETFYMGSLGISSRQFIQDSYIFQDGIIEDVPVGTIYSITGGIQHKNKKNRPYIGAKVSHGNYFSWGFLSTNFEYGTFLDNGRTEQTAYSFQANYFTNLINLGDKWKMRQFVKPQLLIGTSRLNSIGDRLTIDENNRFQEVYGNQDQRENSAGIPGFSSNLYGTKKFVLSSQTQFYSPWQVLGFRLNPYLNFTSALLGNEGESIMKSKVYSSFGIGFIVRNDFLVFSSFQFSLAYYPSIPGNGNHIIDTNSFSTEDFGFQSFELGKPTPIWFN